MRKEREEEEERQRLEDLKADINESDILEGGLDGDQIGGGIGIHTNHDAMFRVEGMVEGTLNEQNEKIAREERERLEAI